MKRNIFLMTIALFVFIQGFGQSIETRLAELANTYPFTFKKLKVDTLFSEKFLIEIEQPIDHKNPESQKFTQRVFLSHLDTASPMVIITEGYAAYYAQSPRHINEVAGLIVANQVCVEHRYFGKSTPDSLDWQYLTVENAASDHHHIINLLKNIYDDKWVSTGISKGGQTSMYHRYFYPEDVDITIPYVAPLNFSIEDKRVYSFLETVATEECRNKVYEFQEKMFINKADILPKFKKMADQKKLSYRMGIEKAYELTVLEYSFAFFQWGTMVCDSIPLNETDPDKLVEHLDKIAGIRWISNEGIHDLQPFFYQAMREIGFYGYDIEPFKEWTSYESDPTFEFSLPEGVTVNFEPELMQDVDHFVRHKADNMIFIYGEYDPWSSTAVDLTLNTNSIKIVKPEGSHRTRIRNLDEEQKQLLISTLKIWLEE